MVAGLVAMLIGAAGIRIHQDANVALVPPQACNIAAAPRFVPAGESYDGVELSPEPLSKALDEAGLSIRSGCAWGVPGRSPYKGSVKQALVAAKLPLEVVHKIDAMVERGAVSDRVEIRRNSIRTKSGKRHFDTKIVAMGFGRTMCFGTHVNFEPGHVEIADLYDATDATGTTYAVMIPYVCGNVSVLAERAERPDGEVAGTGEAISPPAGTRTAVPPVAGSTSPQARSVAMALPGVGGGSGGVWVSPETRSTTPGTDGKDGKDGGESCQPTPTVRSVPEPGTIAILIAALAAMAVSNRIAGRRGRNKRTNQ